MLRKLSMSAAIAGALSLAAIPFAMGVASAQEPPSAPTPSDAGAGSKDTMSKDTMSKGGKMSMKKGHMKKKKKKM